MNQMFLFLQRQKESRPVLARSLTLFLIGLGFYLLPLLFVLLTRALPNRANIQVLISIFQFLTIVPALVFWALAIFAPLEMRNQILRTPKS